MSLRAFVFGCLLYNGVDVGNIYDGSRAEKTAGPDESLWCMTAFRPMMSLKPSIVSRYC